MSPNTSYEKRQALFASCYSRPIFYSTINLLLTPTEVVTCYKRLIYKGLLAKGRQHPKIGYSMHQIRITRTSDLNSILSFLKERYPLLSEAEIIKMALSNQYYHEIGGEQRAGAHGQDPTKRFAKAQWQKKFAAFKQIRDQITPDDAQELDQAIDQAVQAVRAETKRASGKS
jgi:hypothetical protein